MKEPETLEELIGQAIGEASMLWDKDGVFESVRGKELMERTVAKAREIVKREGSES